MNKKEQQNTYLLVGSRIISRVGDIMFDFANNTFLSSVNVKSLMLVGISGLFVSILYPTLLLFVQQYYPSSIASTVIAPVLSAMIQ